MKPINTTFKRAFTMLELIFVIVIVGILSYMASAGFQRNSVQEATDQLVSHIRYTQHLAMMDNKFSPTIPNYYRNEWHIDIAQDTNNNNLWVYSILSANNTGTYAKDPLDNAKLLSGLFTVPVASRSKDLQLQAKYGITSITFTNCPSSTATSFNLYFDYLGRPYGNKSAATQAQANRLTNICSIVLSNGDITQNMTIEISPETGYVRAHH